MPLLLSFLISSLFLALSIVLFLAIFSLLLNLFLSLLGGAIKQSPQFGDVLLECHGMGNYGMVLDICNFQLSESNEGHQIGLDILLKQGLHLAVRLPTHPAAQSRHSPNFTS